MTAPRYTVDPEIRDLIPPLSEQERAALEADIAKHGNRDPIVVWPHDGHLIVVDGHHRLDACRKTGARIKPAVKMNFADRAEALLWILTNQCARRNLSAAQRSYLIGKRFNAETPGQGARTDLGSGQRSVAERLGDEFKLSDRAVRDCGRFAEAVDILTDTIGVDARGSILAMEVPFSREEIRTIAHLPPDEHREMWEQALKDRSSLKKTLLARTRREGKEKRAEQVKHPGAPKTAAMDRYDLADLVRLIGTNWPAERLEGYDPSYSQQVALETHMEGALRSLVRLAERFGWGEAALDEYRLEQGLEVAPVEEPVAFPDSTEAEQEVSEPDEHHALREHIRGLLYDQSPAKLAKRAGVPTNTLMDFLKAKRRFQARTIVKLETLRS